MNESSGNHRPKNKTMGMGVALALGAGAGVALGVALNNIAFGVAIGAGTFMVFAIALTARKDAGTD